MHRHGYQGRKFGRLRDQRGALLKGLAGSLIEHGGIATTLPKAKELRPFAEKLITRARKGGLYNRRIVIARLGSIQLGNKLVDEIAPQIKRDSGYLRISKLPARRGDNAEMARIEFVDELKKAELTEIAAKAETEAKAAPKTEPTAKKPTTAKPKGAK